MGRGTGPGWKQLWLRGYIMQNASGGGGAPGYGMRNPGNTGGGCGAGGAGTAGG